MALQNEPWATTFSTTTWAGCVRSGLDQITGGWGWNRSNFQNGRITNVVGARDTGRPGHLCSQRLAFIDVVMLGFAPDFQVKVSMCLQFGMLNVRAQAQLAVGKNAWQDIPASQAYSKCRRAPDWGCRPVHSLHAPMVIRCPAWNSRAWRAAGRRRFAHRVSVQYGDTPTHK